MVKIRVNPKFYGGPYDKRTASLYFIPNLIYLHGGEHMVLAAYTKVEELTYLYSVFQSLAFEKTEDGRAEFLDVLLKLPDYGTIWEDPFDLP